MSRERQSFERVARIEVGINVGSAWCTYPHCSTLLGWEATNGGTIHDGSEFWVENCMCHEEDKEHICALHREDYVCENCGCGIKLFLFVFTDNIQQTIHSLWDQM